MAKKLLSEAQVRKFMGLANMDANLSSNFLKEMYHKRDDEEMMNEEEEMEMDADMEAKMDMVDAAPEGGDMEGEADGPDVELDEEEVADAQEAMSKVQAVLDKLMGGAGAGMDDMPAEEPMDDMDMGGEEEIDADVEVEPTEDEIVQEVARRVARRINEAARAQKKADRLLGRKK